MATFKKFRLLRNDLISDAKKWSVLFFKKKEERRIKNIVLLCLKKEKKYGIKKKGGLLYFKNCYKKSLLRIMAKFFKSFSTGSFLLFDKVLAVFIHLDLCNTDIAWMDWDEDCFIIDLWFCD